MSASSDEGDKEEEEVFGAVDDASFSSSSSSCEPVERAEARATMERGRGRRWNEEPRQQLLLPKREVSARGAAETAAALEVEKGKEEEEQGRGGIDEELSLRLASPPARALDRGETVLARPRGGKSPAERADPEKVAREGGSIAPSIDRSR